MSPESGFGGPRSSEPHTRGTLPDEHPMTRVFWGPHGIRVGWRIVIAISLWTVFGSVLPIALIWIPAVRASLVDFLQSHILTPGIFFFGDGISSAAALLAAVCMSRIERRSFAEYGLSAKAVLSKRVWQGLLYGFGMVSALIGLLALLRGFSIAGLAIDAATAARYAILYLLASVVVAIFEEFSFRGYLQATLATATGFWPAAAALSIAFAAAHVNNPGETPVGVVMVGCFGLLAAFTLRRTGNICFAIGMHAAWDWGETFVYSVRDSGMAAKGTLLNSTLHGPTWLTGGSAGPEGSLVVFAVLALSALAIDRLFPAGKHLP
jgi:CAAX protease family protein